MAPSRAALRRRAAWSEDPSGSPEGGAGGAGRGEPAPRSGLTGRVLTGRVLADEVLAGRVLADEALAGRVLAGTGASWEQVSSRDQPGETKLARQRRAIGT
jgi:hypothetical protein